MRPASLSTFALVTVAALPAYAGLGSNGVQMNGVQMNGVQMNGVQMNGVQMNGVQMNGVQMNGVTLSGLWLSGSQLQGTIVDANATSCSHSQKSTGAPMWTCSPCTKVVAKSDPYCALVHWDKTCVNEAATSCAVGIDKLRGATFTANAGDGTTRPLRLDTYETGTGANSDVYLYSFSYRQPGASTWNPICPKPDAGGKIANHAVAVGGQWADCQGQKGYCGGKVSNDGFTLACEDVGAIAKCVERFGYKPWLAVHETSADGTYAHEQTLETFHEACVRMVRGDYCGDGVPHTVDGTEIDVYDHMGVQTQTPLLPTNYHFEGGWTPHGSACISVTRYQSFGGNPNPPPGVPSFPDAIQNCTEISPVQFGSNGQPYIIDGCGNFFDFNPDATNPLPSGTNDWPRLWYYIGDSSSH